MKYARRKVLDWINLAQNTLLYIDLRKFTKSFEEAMAPISHPGYANDSEMVYFRKSHLSQAPSVFCWNLGRLPHKFVVLVPIYFFKLLQCHYHWTVERLPAFLQSSRYRASRSICVCITFMNEIVMATAETELSLQLLLLPEWESPVKSFLLSFYLFGSTNDDTCLLVVPQLTLL